MQCLFSLGQIVATPGALQSLQENAQSPEPFISRHRSGDWGDVSAEDKNANDQALKAGERLLSAYHLRDGKTKIWVITESDRSSTCVLLPSEY